MGKWNTAANDIFLEALGHESVETTRLCERCLAPAGAASLLARVRAPGGLAATATRRFTGC